MGTKRDRLFIILSISAGTALLACMLSFVWAVLIDPLPFPQSNRIVTIKTVSEGSLVSTSLPDYRDLAQRADLLQNGIYVKSLPDSAEIDGRPERVYAVSFAGNLSTVFQSPPLLGDPRDLDSAQKRNGLTAVLSYSAWTKFFSADPQVIGRTLRVGSNLYELRAVLSPVYQFALPADVWIPTAFPAGGNRGNRDGRIYARLPHAVSLARANAYLGAVASSLQQQYPDTNQGVSFTATPLKESLSGQSETLLYLLACGAGIVLCVAYFNVYQLLLAKTVTASPRWGICLALGINRRRLFLDILKEPLRLSLGGCFFGLLLGVLSVMALRAFSPPDIPRISDTRLVWQIGLFLSLVSILAAVLFALLMSVRILSLQATTASLTGAGRSGASIRHAFNIKRQLLLVAQIALSTTLFICMGMLTEALRQAINIPLGFESAGISATDLNLKEPTNTAAGGEYTRQLTDSVSSLPAVQRVALASSVPFQKRSYSATFTTEAMNQDNGKELQFVAVSPQFFQTLHIPLVLGRAFSDSDDSNHLKVAILNQAAAKTFFGTADGLNKRIRADLGSPSYSLQVVGIVEDVRQDPTTVVAPSIVYLPLNQTTMYSVSLVVSSRLPLASAEIRSRIWSVNGNQAVGETSQLAGLIDLSLRRIRFTGFLMTLFATITMLLSALGIYGTVAQWLSTGEREVALRLACGATYSQIHGSVVTRIMSITGLALVAGAIAAVEASNAIKSLLYGVQPNLAMVLALATVILAAIAALSSYMPALRARFVEPMRLLRAE